MKTGGLWLLLGGPLAWVAATSLAWAEPSPTAIPPFEAPVKETVHSLGDTLSGDAKRDYDVALLLYDSGDFAGAAQRFTRAYEQAEDVRLLWNAAACEQAQRHYAKAITLLRRYLGSRSPLITEESERSARAFLDAAIPLTARLVVEANQPATQAYVDGRLVGTLPLEAETRVDFGTHRFLVRKPQFVDQVQTVTVTSDADVQLVFKLEPVPHLGRLVVQAQPGDSIALDGTFRALSSFDGPLPSGKHSLRVSAAGSRAFETSVLIEDGRTRALDVTLERASLVSRVPTWVWVTSGAALLAGAGTTAYLMARSSGSDHDSLISGSAGKVTLPLR